MPLRLEERGKIDLNMGLKQTTYHDVLCERLPDAKKVSIIIAHDKKRGTEILERCLQSVKKSTFFSGLNEEAEVVISEEPGKTYSRNDAVRKSKGNLLVFIDDDAVSTDSWLHELLKPFKDVSVGAVGGPSVLMPHGSLREAIADKLLYSSIATWKSSSRYLAKGETRFTDESELHSCNLAIRRDVFDLANGFPDIVPCEENALLNNMENLGFKLVYTPLAVVHHSRAPLFLPYTKKMFYYGTGRGKMIRRYGFRKGRPRFINPTIKSTIYFLIGLVLHYVSYISGLIWGLMKG